MFDTTTVVNKPDGRAFLVPLDTLAADINARFERTALYEKKADEHRIGAGLQLIQARSRVDAGEAGRIRWEEWCLKNIRRSLGDIRKVMKLAGAADPENALREERAKAAAGMAQHRANVSAVNTQPEAAGQGHDYRLSVLEAFQNECRKRSEIDRLKQVVNLMAMLEITIEQLNAYLAEP